MKVSKRILSVGIVFFGVALSAPALPAQNLPGGINKVVIDAGHGGKDPGAVYGAYREKDINLAVALRLGELIRANYPQVIVIFTRSTDVFVPLADRADKANKAAADLFISIHVNSNKSSAPYGTDTYVMGVDKAGRNLDIAMKENDVIVYEENYTTRYQGYTPGSAESFIIFSLMQYSYQGQSLNLAGMVQQQYAQNTPFANRGVKQAGFLVLWYAAMPSILTEMGFISNEHDRKILITKNGQEKLARSLFNAFSEYKVKSEGAGQRIVLGNSSEPEEAAVASSEAAPAEAPAQPAAEAIASSPTSATSGTASGKVCYRVQVASSPQKIARNAAQFGKYRGEVKEILIGGRYKYFVGEVASYQEALSLQAEVRKQIKDAFLVPFEGETLLTLQQARSRE